MHRNVFPTGVGAESSERLPSSLRQASGLRAVVLLLTLGIVAFSTACAPEREAEISIPVRTEGLAEGLVLLAPPPSHIAVTLNGKPSAIERLLEMNLPYSLDLEGAGPGRHRFPVTLEQVSLPSGLQVLKAEPTFLEIRIEQEMTKKVPVNLSFTGEPPKGYHVAASAVDPREVTLCGPESALGSIETILTKPVDLSGRTESFRQETALKMPIGLQTQPRNQSIQAEVTVKEESTTRQLEPMPVAGVGSPGTVTIVPSEIHLRVQGPIRSIEKLPEVEGFRVYVNLEGLKPGVYVRRATIDLPVGIQLIQAKPELFTVTISKAP